MSSFDFFGPFLGLISLRTETMRLIHDKIWRFSSFVFEAAQSVILIIYNIYFNLLLISKVNFVMFNFSVLDFVACSSVLDQYLYD